MRSRIIPSNLGFVLLLVLTIVSLSGAKNTSPETFFLGLVLPVLMGRILSSCGRLSRPGSGSPTYIRHRRRRRGFRFQAEKFLENIAMVRRTLLAGLGGLGALDKRHDVIIRAGRRGDLVGNFVNAELHNPGRRGEWLNVRIVGQRDGALHELSPDRRGQSGPAQFDVTVVVIADPDNA